MDNVIRIKAKSHGCLHVGVVSDSHGRLRPTVRQALKGCDVILHAGDVGDAQVLSELKMIAPTYAVRGNVDRTGGVASLPNRCHLSLAGLNCLLLHRQEDLGSWDRWWQIPLIVFGHSHQPAWVKRSVGWALNPGAIGPRRFNLPIGLAILKVQGGSIIEVVRVDLNP